MPRKLWSINNGKTYHRSGDAIVVKPGAYNITFNSIDGFVTPASQNITAVAGTAYNIAGSYQVETGIPGSYTGNLYASYYSRYAYNPDTYEWGGSGPWTFTLVSGTSGTSRIWKCNDTGEAGDWIVYLSNKSKWYIGHDAMGASASDASNIENWNIEGYSGYLTVVNSSAELGDMVVKNLADLSSSESSSSESSSSDAGSVETEPNELWVNYGGSGWNHLSKISTGYWHAYPEGDGTNTYITHDTMMGEEHWQYYDAGDYITYSESTTTEHPNPACATWEGSIQVVDANPNGSSSSSSSSSETSQTYVYTVAGSSYSNANGNYYYVSGDENDYDLVYTNGTCYLYENSERWWFIGTVVGEYGMAYYNGSTIPGSLNDENYGQYGTAVVTAYGAGSSSSSSSSGDSSDTIATDYSGALSISFTPHYGSSGTYAFAPKTTASGTSRTWTCDISEYVKEWLVYNPSESRWELWYSQDGEESLADLTGWGMAYLDDYCATLGGTWHNGAVVASSGGSSSSSDAGDSGSGIQDSYNGNLSVTYNAPYGNGQDTYTFVIKTGSASGTARVWYNSEGGEGGDWLGYNTSESRWEIYHTADGSESIWEEVISWQHGSSVGNCATLDGTWSNGAVVASSGGSSSSSAAGGGSTGYLKVNMASSYTWSVDNSNWYNGGSTIELPAGSYTISYRADGYLTDNSDSVNQTVIAGQTTTVNLEFECLAEGTMITLADGTQKAIEDITYDDELLCWDFDNGCQASAKPAWIKKEETAPEHTIALFDDGTVLDMVGQYGHRIYNAESSSFEYAGKDYEAVTADGKILKCIDCKRECSNVNFYNIITKKHFNCYANGILTSNRFSNMYNIEDMKYVKEERTAGEWTKSFDENLVKDLRLDEMTEDMTEYVSRMLSNMKEK